MIRRACLWGVVGALMLSSAVAPAAAIDNLDWIRVSSDRRGFENSRSHVAFHPWGFNYDRDRSGRLLEDYWLTEWNTVVDDFREMKALGANTVRIHLQLGRFMRSERKTRRGSLRQLRRLLQVAEATGLYLDVTGLGCYKKPDVPEWYNQLGEARRWAVQARFWAAVAETCRASPAVFCYDLMNEPVVTEDKNGRDWTPGAFGDRYFVQRLTLDFAGRTPQQIARAWVDRMVGAIRRQDRRHLVTVGVIPWALTFPGAKPLFYAKEVGAKLDFVSVHFYPKRGEVNAALRALDVYAVGKPIVIEEMFPLNCSVTELGRFIDGSREVATGWLGFYWGETIEEYKQHPGSAADGLTRDWLEYFRSQARAKAGPEPEKP